MSTKPAAAEACLLITLEVLSGCSEPVVSATLGTREGSRGDDGAEYPRTPDVVRGLFTDHDFGLHTFVTRGAPLRNHSGPEYRRLAFADAYKVERASKAMKTIARKLAKIRDTRGYPTSWEEAVLRFAEVTGCKTVAIERQVVAHVCRTEGRGVPEWTPRWDFRSPGDARGFLRALALSWAPEAERAAG